MKWKSLAKDKKQKFHDIVIIQVIYTILHQCIVTVLVAYNQVLYNKAFPSFYCSTTTSYIRREKCCNQGSFFHENMQSMILGYDLKNVLDVFVICNYDIKELWVGK